MYRRRGFAPNEGGALVRRLFGDFDRFFEDAGAPLFRRRAGFSEFAWIPEMEIAERDDQLMVRLDLPGLKKEEVNVTATDDYLTIEGERKHEVEEKKNEWTHTERTYGKFARTIPLPEGVKASDIAATFENGVLTVAVPLAAASITAAPQKVAIGGGEEKKAVKTAACRTKMHSRRSVRFSGPPSSGHVRDEQLTIRRQPFAVRTVRGSDVARVVSGQRAEGRGEEPVPCGVAADAGRGSIPVFPLHT